MENLLRFGCNHCHTQLEVPLEYAGVTGPCPCCSQTITAPNPPEVQMEPAQVAELVQTQLPPPRSVQPQNQPAYADPDDQLAPHPPTHAHSHGSSGKERPQVNAPLDPRPAMMRRPGPRVSDHGPNLPTIMGVGTLGLGCLAIAMAFGLYAFTKPKEVKTPEVVAANVDSKVTARADMLEKKKEAAVLEAVDIVREFLARGASDKGARLLTSLGNTSTSFPHPLFPALEASQLIPQKVTRKPGGEDFYVELAGPERTPIFLVEQSNGSCRIHADALREQVEDSLANFLKDPSSSPHIGYFQARLMAGTHPNPALAEWRVLELIPAFPVAGTRVGFVAGIEPHSPIGKRVEERLLTSSWSSWENALLEVKWSKALEGDPYIQVISIIPSGWSKL